MPSLPRLNQICTISEREINHRGTKTYHPVAHNIPCRLTKNNATTDNSQGELNVFNAVIHLGVDYQLNKGMIITDDCGDNYQVENVYRTPDLNGNVFMQYAELTLIYAN